MVLLGLMGMRFDTDGVRFEPCVPNGISTVDLRNVRYRKMIIGVTIRGTGTKVRQCLINGRDSADHRLSASAEGLQEVTIVLGEG